MRNLAPIASQGLPAGRNCAFLHAKRRDTVRPVIQPLIWVGKGETGSAAGHAHMAGDGGALMRAVDDEIMTLRLAQNGLVYGAGKIGITVGSA